MDPASVLIADDLQAFLLVAKIFLERRGLRVLTAENGAKALEVARARHPRLILLDFVMPEMDGAAACAAMRQDPTLAFTPIIIMSGTGDQEIRDRCLAAGCTKFLVKPAKPPDLLNVIANVLAVRERKVTRTTVIFNEVVPEEGRQQVGMAGNLSGTGILLLSDKPIRAGSVLHLEFVVPKTAHTVRVRGKVTHVSRNTEGTYGAGIHFTDLTPADQASVLSFVNA